MPNGGFNGRMGRDTVVYVLDVLEVLRAICIARGHTLEELEQLRAKKAAERGGFEERIFLEYVE